MIFRKSPLVWEGFGLRARAIEITIILKKTILRVVRSIKDVPAIYSMDQVCLLDFRRRNRQSNTIEGSFVFFHVIIDSDMRITINLRDTTSGDIS